MWPNLPWVGFFSQRKSHKNGSRKAKMGLKRDKKHNSGRVYIRLASLGERSRQRVLLQMTLQIFDPPVSNSTKAQTPFERSMRHLKLPFVPAQRRRRQQFLSVPGRYKYTPYRAIGKCGGTKSVFRRAEISFGAVQRWVGCRNEKWRLACSQPRYNTK